MAGLASSLPPDLSVCCAFKIRSYNADDLILLHCAERTGRSSKSWQRPSAEEPNPKRRGSRRGVSAFEDILMRSKAVLLQFRHADPLSQIPRYRHGVFSETHARVGVRMICRVLAAELTAHQRSLPTVIAAARHEVGCCMSDGYLPYFLVYSLDRVGQV